MFKTTNQKLTTIFNIWKKKNNPTQDLTPKIAYEIQKQEYANKTKSDDTKCTPPYLQIAQNLSSDKLQVFEASVFYLCQIATIKPQYTLAISDIFQNYISANLDNAQRIEIIKTTCKKHKICIS